MKPALKWRPGYVATSIALVAAFLALVLAYQPAVDWFAALHTAKASSLTTAPATPTLPVTGIGATPAEPGFPWWALVVIIATLFASLFIWRAGYENILASSSQATAKAAARRARHYTFGADVYKSLDEERTSNRLRSLGGRFARAALAFQGTSRLLERIDGPGGRLNLPPVSDDADTLPPVLPNHRDYHGMPPRLDSLDGSDTSMPPRL